MRCTDGEKVAWVAAAGERGLSRFVRDVVNAALAERACAGETERPPSRAVVAGPLPVAAAARSVSVAEIAERVPGVTTAARLGGVCSKSGWPVSECLCPSCKAVRLGG